MSTNIHPERGLSREPGPLRPLDPRRWRALALLAAIQFMLFLLILYMQQVLGYSPLRTGVLCVPLGVGIGAGLGASSALMPRIGVKAVLAIGFTGSAAGLLVASFIHVSSSYTGGILPGLIVFGAFSGMTYPALINGGLHEVTGQDAGLASGVQTAMQQVGSALGLATLVTLALRYASDRAASGVPPAAAQVDGYALAFRVGAAVLAAAAVLVLLLMQRVSASPRTALAEVPSGEAPAARIPAR